jgi:hypothetical protein
MINLRDPVLHRSDDSDKEADHNTPPHAGYVSTVVVLDTFSGTVETPLESDTLTQPGLLYSIRLTHITLTEFSGVEPDLERMRRNALESVWHKTSSNLRPPLPTSRRMP